MLADNRPAFTLNIIPESAGDTDQLITRLNKLISISEKDIAGFKKRAKRSKGFTPVPLKYNLNEEERAILAVNSHVLAGTEVSAQLMRFYPARTLTHLSRVMWGASMTYEIKISTLIAIEAQTLSANWT